MKILLATPCHGHHGPALDYRTSFNDTISALAEKGGHNISHLDLEISPINRARDVAAHIAVENNMDKLWFVDSDISWRPEHLFMLLNSDKKIIGGTYTKKEFPLQLTFNSIKEHLDDWNVHKFGLNDFNNFRNKWADQNGEVEVHHLPTGFMTIDVAVLKEMSKTARRYYFWSKVMKRNVILSELFPFQLIPADDGTDIFRFEAEDWGFCTKAHEAGFKVYLQTKCLVDHIGSYSYSVRGHEVF